MRRIVSRQTCLRLVVVAILLPQVCLAEDVDFNKQIRSILSNKCFQCHGPDDAERQAGLRLDQQSGAFAKLDSGERAVVPGEPKASELIARITSDDEDLRMPPKSIGKPLSKKEIQLLTAWVQQGAKYAKHWSYEKPIRPSAPRVQQASWPRNDIDRFILRRLEAEGLAPTEVADRYTLIRRVSLDLTGLPPTLDEVKQFIGDKQPKAYERLVDRMLAKEAYGEHWARKWLDLARYADSAGYADDPPRTIWGYRDWVIKAINSNMPFDEFTLHQLAGDLVENPSTEQLVATAFHRNTLTNNEGGTNDEEYRNVAIVDRVNTTMAVWMGTTMACAQCHNHKFDPITQEEYFRLFAIFNNTEDADRRNESPLVSVYTDKQIQQKKDWEAEIRKLETTLATATPKLKSEQKEWERSLSKQLGWQRMKVGSAKAKSGTVLSIESNGTIKAAKATAKNVYSVNSQPAEAEHTISAIRLSTHPDDSLPGKGAGFGGGNFVVTRVRASINPPGDVRQAGRYVRVDLPGNAKMLSLAEVQVFDGSKNIAREGTAKQSSTDYGGPANLANDGNTNGDYNAAKSTTHTRNEANPWWEVDLKTEQPIDRIVVWNRTDNNLQSRLNGYRISILDSKRQVVWKKENNSGPKADAKFSISNVKPIEFKVAHSDFAQPGFSASNVLTPSKPNDSGWAVGGQIVKRHHLILIPKAAVNVPKNSVVSVVVEQLSKHSNHTLGRFSFSTTSDIHAEQLASLPSRIVELARQSQRSTDENKELTEYYLTQVAPSLAKERNRLADLKKQLASQKPATTVPIMREMPKGRVTNIQHRGNFLDRGRIVTPGLPSIFAKDGKGKPSRLDLALWIVDPNNPLTARVIANRYWEAIFGVGLVRTSEEFGSQGELPSHPQLLDWLATELVRLEWDTKAFVKLLVTTAAYQQSSKVSESLYERDPDNRLLARGPRFRLSAEMIRDQALFVSGLLSPKMFGPPVRPPQPKLGVSAAFGGGIDWATSAGEDRYRRGLYTTWRRSNPYPSMAAFDAPNREVCTIRRDRTNTPLQALVTLNDPVYVEAAQSLGRRMYSAEGGIKEQLRYGFQLCVARPPQPREMKVLSILYQDAIDRYAKAPELAREMATVPIGPEPKDSNVSELAALTIVANVLLNLDEMFLKR